MPFYILQSCPEKWCKKAKIRVEFALRLWWLYSRK